MLSEPAVGPQTDTRKAALAAICSHCMASSGETVIMGSGSLLHIPGKYI